MTDERDWKKESLTYTQRNGMVEVTLTGTYQDVQTTVYFTIAPTGKMHVRYQTSGEPNGYLRETGLAFHLPDSYRQLEWQRKGLWSCYRKMPSRAMPAGLLSTIPTGWRMAKSPNNLGLTIPTTTIIGQTPEPMLTSR